MQLELLFSSILWFSCSISDKPDSELQKENDTLTNQVKKLQSQKDTLIKELDSVEEKFEKMNIIIILELLLIFFQTINKMIEKKINHNLNLDDIFQVNHIFQLTKFKENQFRQSAQNLIDDIKESGVSIIDEVDKNINYSDKTIQIFVYGNKLDQQQIEKWTSKLPDYGLINTNLLVQQGADDSDLRHEVQNLSDLYVQNQKIISSRDETVKEKEDKIKLLTEQLSKYEKSEIPFIQLSKEAQINYNGLLHLSYAKLVHTNFNTIDTITVFNAKWNDTIPNVNNQQLLLKKWLKTRLNLDTLQLNNN